MAFRAVARGSPVVSSQVRTLLQSGRLQQRPTYSTQPEYTGNSLNEKEKAAENRFIRKLEEDRKVAAATGKAVAAGTAIPGESPEAPLKSDAAAEGGFRNTAVVAGLIAAVAGYWLLSGSSSSKKEEKESS